jgi:hypothetical protein
LVIKKITSVLKPEKLQLAVIRHLHILANYNLPLKTALYFKFLVVILAIFLSTKLEEQGDGK